MIVDVKINDSILRISCGDGKQSFKWLASVIKSRTTRETSGCEQFMITEIRNSSAELINPSDLIFEHSGPHGLQVTATLSKVYPVDEWENPKMGDWLKGAYLVSEIGKNWFAESDIWRDSLSTVKSNSNNYINRNVHHQSESSLVKIGFDFSNEDISSAFDLDWASMKWTWLTSVGAGEFTEKQRNAMGDTFKTRYALVCNIFAHYCGIGQVGQRYGLTVSDFAHLLHSMRLYNAKSRMADIEEVYFVSGNITPPSRSPNNSSNGSSSSKWPLMTRAHLCQALAYIAIKENNDAPMVEATQAFLAADGPLDAFWTAITSSYIYHTCGAEDMAALRKTTLEYYQLLKQAFESRAVVHPVRGPQLSLSSFVSMLVESSMVEPEHEAACVRSFVQAQLLPGGAEGAQWELEEAVFCEFVEALSRVSVKTIEKESGLSDAKKIRMAFNFMTELQPLSSIGGRGSHK